MRVEDIERSGELSLQALLAGIDQVDAARQIPLLRSAIDLALDRVAAAENCYYDFLGECAMLASQNMQDVRLHDVERRLERLENPESPGIAEVLVETAMILAVELVVTVGAPWLAGPVLVFASSRLIARSSKVTARRAARIAKERVEIVSTLESDLLGARLELGEMRRRLRDPDTGNPLGQYAVANLLGTIEDTVAKIQRTEKAAELVGQDPSKADAIVRAYYDALAGRVAKPKSQPLRDFLNGASGHTLKGRIGESSGQQLASLLSEARKQAGNSSGALAESPFLSSTVVGEILSRLRELRMEAARGHSYTRQLLNQIDEAYFATDTLAQDIARGIFDAIAPLENALALADVVRPVVVRGFEALLWHEWLTITGALQIEPEKTFQSPMELEPGDLYNGHLMSKTMRKPEIEPGLDPLGKLAAIAGAITGSGYINEGDFYHGIPKLSEYQAKYLYDTFASAYFAVPENASLLPFKNAYDPDRYAETLDKAPRTTGEILSNFERERRLDEMRLIVVIFFINFVSSKRGKVSFGAVTDTPILVDDYLSHFPETQPAEPSSDTAEPTPEEFAYRLNALFGEAGVEARYQAGISAVEFEGHMTLLETRIWIFELVYSQLSYEAAEAPDGRTATEAADEIRQLKTLVSDEYQILLNALTVLDPDAASDFEKLYKDRKDELISSQVGDPLPAKARFP